jgi:hypothetical protein
MYRAPHPRLRFFRQAAFQENLGQGLLQLTRLGPKAFDLIAAGLTLRVSHISARRYSHSFWRCEPELPARVYRAGA